MSILADLAISERGAQPSKALNDETVILVEPDRLPLLGINFEETELHDMIERGEFPRPIALSATRLGWRLSTIRAWIDGRERATSK